MCVAPKGAIKILHGRVTINMSLLRSEELRSLKISLRAENRIQQTCVAAPEYQHVERCSALTIQIRWKPFKISFVVSRRITGLPCGQVVGDDVSTSRSINQRIFSGASVMFTLMAA